MRLYLAMCAGAAQAQTMPCVPRAKVLKMLAQAEQTRRAVGHAGRAVMETIASDAGAWTIAISQPDGRMCLLANGKTMPRGMSFYQHPAARSERFSLHGGRGLR